MMLHVVFSLFCGCEMRFVRDTTPTNHQPPTFGRGFEPPSVLKGPFPLSLSIQESWVNRFKSSRLDLSKDNLFHQLIYRVCMNLLALRSFSPTQSESNVHSTWSIASCYQSNQSSLTWQVGPTAWRESISGFILPFVSHCVSNDQQGIPQVIPIWHDCSLLLLVLN